MTPFTHAVDMVSGELTATHNELLTINGTSAVNSHRAAVELLYTRLATVGHYAGFDFDARKTCEHWAAIRAELLPIAKAATANGKEHVELIKREWTLVAKRRLECATATEGTASEPAAVELPTTSAPPPLPDKAWLSHVELASHYELNPENLRQRLNTWRKKHAAGEGWKEAPERRPREPKYLYRVGAVRSIAEDMMTETSSGETSG
ncbi:MAG TPA: hypothetical protein VFI31_14905 [Pirellulales bacterium]|nr:hypothetical protein [Pirellulales bacterium]